VSLGFADQSHFTRTFGRFIGVTPKSFANRHWRSSITVAGAFSGPHRQSPR
jgi:AraC-like DNA-binding protein